MKRLFIVTTLLTAFILMSFGATFTVDKITYKTLTDNTVAVTGFTLSMTDVVVPSKVTYQDVEYDVKEIAERGLYGYKNGYSSSMKSLTIEEGIEKIGKEAIVSNKKLEMVSLPSTLVEIGESAFYNLAKLQSIEFPNGSNLLVIGDKAFKNSEKLKEFEIPSTVTSIGEWAFSSCKNLTSATIPLGVDILKNNTFSGCGNLQTVVLHKNIRCIEKDAFQYCSSLENIDTKMLADLEFIGDGAFYGVPGIKHLILNGKAESIGISAFAKCNNLEYVWLKEGITTLSKFAFGSCRNLKYIVLPSSLKNVASGAFGESEEQLLDYTNHDPRTFFFLSNEPFDIQYSSTTDGGNVYPSLGKIVSGDKFYVKESAVPAYKEKWKFYQTATNCIDYQIPFNAELTYSTNYREFDMDFTMAANSGNKPFVAVGYGNDYVQFRSIDSNIIPAETGIVIRKNSNNDTWYQIAENQGNTIDETNFLKGVTYSNMVTPTTTTGEVNYVLNNGIFCTFNNSGYLGDHKAYLQLPSSTINQAKEFIFESSTTNIDDIRANTDQNNIYNLNGMKVQNPKNGVYIINNKKVIIKK